MDCFFCGDRKKVIENDMVYAMYDEFPVSDGHMLFVTKRHIKDFFEATEEERSSLFRLVNEGKRILDEKYKPTGYNIGMNCGLSAGQTVMHLHVHLIPRYDGDVENPRGGVRGVIPNKQKY